MAILSIFITANCYTTIIILEWGLINAHCTICLYLQLDKADSSSVGALDKAGEENEPDFYEQVVPPN